MDAEPLAGRPVLLLGASGFLGRHVHTALTGAGAQVVTVSRGTLDLRTADSGALAELCADTGATRVVNAVGAVWGGTESEMEELNGALVARLTEAVASAPRRPRLVHLGSAYEYGPAEHGTTLTEDRAPAPATVYGRTKLRGTRHVLRAAEDGLDAVVLRVSVACGPGAPRTSLPGIVADHLAAGHAELRLAPLRAHRDLVDVRDVADAVVAAAQAPTGRLAGRVVNIGSGRAVPVRSLVDLMVALGGRRVRVVEEAGRPVARSDAPWQRLDITRARDLLGWRPRRALEESLRDLLATVGVPTIEGKERR
jgi:NDP-hexose 4-ketoreductase